MKTRILSIQSGENKRRFVYRGDTRDSGENKKRQRERTGRQKRTSARIPFLCFLLVSVSLRSVNEKAAADASQLRV